MIGIFCSRPIAAAVSSSSNSQPSQLAWSMSIFRSSAPLNLGIYQTEWQGCRNSIGEWERFENGVRAAVYKFGKDLRAKWVKASALLSVAPQYERLSSRTNLAHDARAKPRADEAGTAQNSFSRVYFFTNPGPGEGRVRNVAGARDRPTGPGPIRHLRSKKTSRKIHHNFET